jgi:predicted component of type VI protein secretion system
MTDETAIYLRVRGDVVCVNGRSAVAGRSRNCDVQLDEQGVSRRHCEVLLRDDGVSIRDLGSSHGTWVGGRRISSEERLPAGVLVTLGAKGPHFELVNAIVHGRPVLGPAATVAMAARDATVVRAPARAAPTSAPAVAAPAPAGGEFARGLAWGVVAGIVAGIATAVFVHLPV